MVKGELLKGQPHIVLDPLWLVRRSVVQILKSENSETVKHPL